MKGLYSTTETYEDNFVLHGMRIAMHIQLTSNKGNYFLLFFQHISGKSLKKDEYFLHWKDLHLQGYDLYKNSVTIHSL